MMFYFAENGSFCIFAESMTDDYKKIYDTDENHILFSVLLPPTDGFTR